MGDSFPFYRPLTPKSLAQIDQAGRQILERVGIRVLSPDYLERLGEAGADIDREKGIARFGGSCLDRNLRPAPSKFTLFSRDGNNDLRLGEGNVYFGNGGRAFRILDWGTRGYRRTMLRDVAHTATLVHHLEHLRFYIVACQAHDVGPEHYHRNDFYYSLNHTTKHVMGGVGSCEGAEQVWKLASLIAGGEDRLREKPFVSVITNPISPLTLDFETLRIIEFCVGRGIPVTCASAPIAGATAPVTLAGTLALMHAEALAGVAISQIFSPGAKALYGAVPTAMDLRTAVLTMGSVEMGMMNAAAVQLAKHYRLPIYASAGLTEAKRPDIQAGVEKHFSCLTVAMTGADFIHLAAGMIDSANSITYEQYVIDNEIIGMTHRILRGIRVDSSTLGVEVIEKVGPGGNFITEDHTVDHMMKELYYPRIAVRCNFDVWEEKGRPSMMSRSHEIAQQILDENRDGLLDPAQVARIKEELPGIKKM